MAASTAETIASPVEVVLVEAIADVLLALDDGVIELTAVDAGSVTVVEVALLEAHPATIVMHARPATALIRRG